MFGVREQLVATLARIAGRLHSTGLPPEVTADMEALARQVDQPCVVAVVGRVNAGKSTFVNALLGEELAKVGTTETTATINYFSYGTPNPDRPVRCHWRNGTVTDESRAFLDGLQGNDVETLRRADGIDHLEYFLPNPFLKHITLVDTPGTGAVVGEHQNTTAEFMKLHGQLRQRHDEDTRRLGDTADAVIYLTGQVARATERDFLEEFSQASGGRSKALNAVGVMAKIELQPEVMARRHELSEKIASQLKESLNTVIPVGAGVRRALDHLSEDGEASLKQMVKTLRSIPPKRLDMMLDDKEFFCGFDFPDSPVSTDERRRLVGEMPWAVFTTIAQVVANPDLSVAEVEDRLEEISNFERLRKVLDEHFVSRGHVLRCFRIVEEARRVVGRIKFKHLPEQRRRARRDNVRLEQFLSLIERAGGDPDVSNDLQDFVRRHLEPVGRASELEALYEELDDELSALRHDLLEHNADFEALRQLEDHKEEFSLEEQEELRPLLGLFGTALDKRLPPGNTKVEYVEGRQADWKLKREMALGGSVRQAVADRAYTRYGWILEELYRG